MEFSFQLYSARNFPPVTELFKTLKYLGYTQVEGFGGLYGEADELAGALNSSGLTMPTGHFALDDLNDTSSTLKIASTLGIKTIICPYILPDQRGQGSDGWKALAEKLAKFGETYQKEGLNFAWHNHDFEFDATETGEVPMQLILEGAPNIGWQIDVAWVIKAGQDPLKWIERYGKRIVSVHVKDIAPAGHSVDEDGWADLGEGTMDWKTLFAAITQQTDCQSFVMEHDNPNDVVRFATRSIAAARGLRK